MKKASQLRPVTFERHFTRHAAGSVLIRQGNTWVLCTASIEEKVPPFLRGNGQGWVTAEYSMLPSSTIERKEREIKRGKPDARDTEISRLIGRALRAAIDMEKLGKRSTTIYKRRARCAQKHALQRHPGSDPTPKSRGTQP